VDTLDGGAGADTLFARDGARDLVVGGADRDTAAVDKVDRVTGVELRTKPKK
jgi:Ca2+-binding RTX toxin-like protein